MIGGIVRSVNQVNKHLKTALLVQDDRSSDFCVVNVQTDIKINVGDTVWWQGRFVYWTPKDRSGQDVPLNRLGSTYEWWKGIE